MYSRFKALERYDLDALRDSKAVIVGLGATGSVISEHLARHGVELVLIDRDYLEMNDLYSSNLYTKEQCKNAMPKAKAAEKHLSELTNVESHVTDLRKENAELLEADIVIDGTDNIETRLIIENFSKQKNIPWIYTAALGERGYSMFIRNQCFKCLFDQLNPKKSCEKNGVMREISSITASKSALKAVKFLSGLEVEEKLEILPEMDSFEFGSCECSDFEAEASQVCGDNKYQVTGSKDPKDFSGDILAQNDYLKRVSFDGSKITIFNSGRAIIEASSLEEAEQLYKEASSI